MTSDVQPLTLRTPYDVIGAVPHLLGFPPQESLVVICLALRRVLLTLRFDLPEPGDEQPLADEIAARAAHAGASEVLLVCFTDQVGPMLTRPSRSALPRRRFVRRVRNALTGRGLTHRDALLVAQDRWWSYVCTVPACCPPQGTALAEPSSTLLALQAEKVLGGEAVVASRDELARSIEPAPLAGSCAADGAGPAGGPASTGRATDEDRRALVTLYAGWRSGPGSVSGGERIVRALRDIDFRDEVLSWTAHTDGPTLLALLVALCRLAEDGAAAPVCSVLAWAAYQQGNGALANVAVERALRVEPGYSLALLLAELMVRQVPPTGLREVSAGLDLHPLFAAAGSAG